MADRHALRSAQIQLAAKMPRGGFVIAGLLAVLLLAAWSLWNIELIEQQSDPFFSEEAGNNPYLAAQLFLERMHHVVSEDEDENALERLPEGKSVIILASGRAHLPEERQTELLNWISKGGHLITLATREWNEKTESIDDLLQRQFDVAAVRTGDNSMELVKLLFENSGGADDTQSGEDETPLLPESHQNAQAGAAEDAQSDLNEPSDPIQESADQCLVQTPLGTTDIEWFDGQALVADIGGKLRLEIGDVEPTISAADAQGLQLVQFGYGFGKITFLSNMSLWTNHQIENFDNAHLLALMVGDANRIIILHDFDAVPLTDLLKHYFPATLIMLVVLTAMIIFHFQLRWGPVIDNRSPPRRSLHEHIAAGGRLLWQHRQVSPLVKLLQQQISEQIARAHPTGAPTDKEIHQTLTTQTGITADKIRTAMQEPANESDQLLDQIRLLQTIRNSL